KIGGIVGGSQLNGEVCIVTRNGISPILVLVRLQIKFLQDVEKALLILDRHEQDAIPLNDVAVRVQRSVETKRPRGVDPPNPIGEHLLELSVQALGFIGAASDAGEVLDRKSTRLNS